MRLTTEQDYWNALWESIRGLPEQEQIVIDVLYLNKNNHRAPIRDLKVTFHTQDSRYIHAIHASALQNLQKSLKRRDISGLSDFGC